MTRSQVGKRADSRTSAPSLARDVFGPRHVPPGGACARRETHGGTPHPAGIPGRAAEASRQDGRVGGLPLRLLRIERGGRSAGDVAHWWVPDGRPPRRR